MKANSTRTSNSFLPIILPSIAAAVLYVVISLILLALLNIHEIWELFFGTVVGPIDSSYYQPLTAKLTVFENKLNTPSFLAFWALIGSISYSVIWLLQSVVLTAREEVAESNYLQGGKSRRTSYWRNALINNLILLVVIFVWLVCIFAYLRFVLPGCSTLMHKGVFEMPMAKGFLHVAEAVFGNAVAFHVVVQFYRALIGRWRIIRA